MRIRSIRSAGARRGVALLLVIFVVLGVVVLGTAMLYSNTQRALSSHRLSDGRRALFLAESGAVRAKWRLSQSDTSSAGYWTGVKLQHIDRSQDYYDIEISCADGRYEIVSTGCVLDAGGHILARQRIVSHVRARSEWDAGVAVFSESMAVLPSAAVIVGDVYSGSLVLNDGSVAGSIIAQSLIVGSGSVSGLQTPWSSVQINGPDVALDYYDTYTLDGSTYHAAHYYDKDLKADNPLNDGGAITDTNIKGVVFMDHQEDDPAAADVMIKKNVNFHGTLIVQGNLVIDGDNVTLRAEPGFPALIVTGDLILQGSSKHRTIDGPVIIGGWFNAEGHDNSTMTINGALIFKGSGLFSPFFTQGSIMVNYDSAKGRIRELRNQTAGPAVGPLNWKPRGDWTFWTSRD